jgi:multidrug resistance efflux pump
LKKVRRGLIKFSSLIAIFFIFFIFIFTIVILFGKMDETVEGYGIISPENERIISSSLSGIIASIYVKEGDFVEKGDEIFRLKDEPFHFQKEIASLEFLKAEAEYIEAKRELDYLNNSKEELEKLKEAYRRATINFEKAKRELDIRKELYKEGIISFKELIDSEIDLKIKESEKEMASKELDLFLSKKEMERSLAKLRLEKTMKALEVSKSQMELAEKRVKESVFRAPARGVILEIRKKEGEFVSEGEKIGRMVSLNELIFEMNLPQGKIVKLREGLTAKVFLDAFPFRKYKIFEGKVERISPMAELSGGAFFKVKISLKENWVDAEKNQRIYLKPGLSGRGKVIIERNISLSKLLLNKIIYGGS